jgi:glycosyltransferase involved in cell wall biosynthesis
MTVIPSKIFEAMGMGLPILLASPDGEASKIIEQDQCGICVPAEDPKALAEAVAQLKDRPELRNRLATNSLHAAEWHTRELQARTTLNVLEQASVAKSGPVPVVKDGPAIVDATRKERAL